MISIHEHQYGAHKIGLKFSIALGRYSINSIYKDRAMEEDMRKVTMRFFKPRKFFNYRGIKNKIIKNYTHIHEIEDVWVDCRTEEDVRKMDQCRLIVEQIENFDLADVPEDLEEDGDIIDPAYEKKKLLYYLCLSYNGPKKKTVL